MIWTPFVLTFKLATLTTVILTVLATPLAYWLAYKRSRLTNIIATLVSMPLVLPPSVLGFYLLLAFSPKHWFGRAWADIWGHSLAFSFSGLLVASVIFSLPFYVQPLRAGFESIPTILIQAANTMGKNRLNIFWNVLLPNMRASLFTGLVMAFAHTVGEFGVVLMIGGSIPKETRVASIAIYDQVESLNYAMAHKYALVLVLMSFLVVFSVNYVNSRNN